jgi:uncharacterized membrane-anchored protein YhcB (DUF1043 family)
MIKFFRKTRYDLMEKNKTGKYFKYAIGEIVLVVIGILIALQINNWNEKRKQTKEEIETLKNIKSDFENTIIEFEENNNFRKRIISTTKDLYNIIHTKQNYYSNRQLDSLMSDLFINPTYNGQSETLNILFNSGKINIISNDSIKNALVLWPQQVEDMTEDEIYSSNIIFKDLYPLLKRYISLYEINNNIKYKGLKLFNNPTQSTTNIDYNGLFKDREFEGTLSSRELPLSVSLIQTTELIEIARKIIRLIEDDINNKK